MTAQQEFDLKYISSTEICERLQITRGGLTLAKKRGVLPDPITIKGGLIHIWERHTIEPILLTWNNELIARRGVAVNA